MQRRENPPNPLYRKGENRFPSFRKEGLGVIYKKITMENLNSQIVIYKDLVVSTIAKEIRILAVLHTSRKWTDEFGHIH